MNPEIKNAAEWAAGQLENFTHGSVTIKFVKHDNRLQYVDKTVEIKEKIKAAEARFQNGSK